MEYLKPVLKKIQKIDCQANAKAISNYDFYTLYIKLPHFDLISVMNDIIEFAFRGGNKNTFSKYSFLVP